MPTWLKVALVLLGLGILGLGLLIGAGAWFAVHKDQLEKDTRAARDEGAAFGAAHTQEECVDDGVTRMKSCGSLGVMCQTNVKFRLMSCMPAAQDTGMCKGVPSPTDIFRTATWANLECQKRGQPSSQPCAQLMTTVAQACAQRP